MTRNQLRFRLLVISPVIGFLSWREGLLNAEPTALLLLVVAFAAFWFALFDIRANKKSNTNQHMNNNTKE
jgi:hypothetical protein